MTDEKNNNQIQSLENQPTGLDIPNLIGKLSPDQLQMLINYTNPVSVLQRLQALNWTPEKEAAEVVKIAKQNDDVKGKLQAIRFLRTLVKDALIASGQFIKAKRKLPYGQEGESVEFSTEFMLPNKSASADNVLDNLKPNDNKSENQGETQNDNRPKPKPNQSGDQEISNGDTEGTNETGDSNNTRRKSRDNNESESKPNGAGNGLGNHGDGIQQHRPPADEHSDMFPGISQKT
jgi:hypothetical protein